MRVAVGIATSNRPELLAETLKQLEVQTRAPDCVIIAPATESSVRSADLARLKLNTVVVKSGAGLPKQRNAILEVCGDVDLLVYFDDDFLPEARYLENAERLFANRENIVMATGKVLADGIKGPGIRVGDARNRLAAQAEKSIVDVCSPVYGAYGCNMAIRLSAVRGQKLSFDENLPLYGWQEDTDFSRQIGEFGDVIRSNSLVGVHLGVKVGRPSGVKLGYSQVANPVYLMKKGTLSTIYGWRLITKNVLANGVLTLCPEPYIDRSGRLRGNILAFRDFLKGSLGPKRILDL